MTQEDFSERISDLADFYQKDIKTETVKQWFYEFGWLAPFQLDGIIRDSKRDCDRFPAGKYFFDQIRNHNFSRPELSGKAESEMVTVVCKCGETFAIERTTLAQPNLYHPFFKSKRSGDHRGCLNCNARYAGELILRKLDGEIARMG